MQAAVGRVPGIMMVAVVDGGVPIEPASSSRVMRLPGHGGVLAVNRRRVTLNYFGLLAIPAVRGRLFSEEDRAGARPVALVNQFAARKFWPGQDPIGQHVMLEDKERVVVGVVGDVHALGPESPPREEVYVPLAQDQTGTSTNVSLVARTAVDPRRLLPAVKDAIWSVNPDQYLPQDVYTLEGYLDRLIAPRRFNMALLVLFRVVGLVIATAGIFGVMAYIVSQRTNEIGVRIALGATPSAIVSMVLRHASLLTGGGLIIGSASAWYLTRFVQTFLFQIRSDDRSVFIGAIATLALAGLAAAAIPARRAANVDPIGSLRQE